MPPCQGIFGWLLGYELLHFCGFFQWWSARGDDSASLSLRMLFLYEGGREFCQATMHLVKANRRLFDKMNLYLESNERLSMMKREKRVYKSNLIPPGCLSMFIFIFFITFFEKLLLIEAREVFIEKFSLMYVCEFHVDASLLRFGIPCCCSICLISDKNEFTGKRSFLVLYIMDSRRVENNRTRWNCYLPV